MASECSLSEGGHAWRDSHNRTAERFAFSRQTLWRLLERDQAGRRPPRAVLDSVGGSVDALEATTRALIAEPRRRSRGPSTRSLNNELHDALLHLCEAPFTTAGELGCLRRVLDSTLRDQPVRLSRRGLVDSEPHRLDALGPRPYRRNLPTPVGIRAVGVDGAGMLPPLPRLETAIPAPGRAGRLGRRGCVVRRGQQCRSRGVGAPAAR
ncbi:MAG: hypothetical protein OXH19_02355 [Chloroflexi bacterium]|nr:hypothetical protein [Chloroflexota bacterium]MCY3588216.1 hypothetical protein [Chloroflexota bacterium]MDE2709255.1 hypothetical protein [Chloroflexota bacterium]